VEPPPGTAPAREEASPDSERASPGCYLHVTPANNLVRFASVPFLGLTGPSDEDAENRARSDRYSTAPHPAKCRNLASRPCIRTNTCCIIPTFMRLSLPFRTTIWTTEICLWPAPLSCNSTSIKIVTK
jgi:hypothetical protein